MKEITKPQAVKKAIQALCVALVLIAVGHIYSYVITPEIVKGMKLPEGVTLAQAIESIRQSLAIGGVLAILIIGFLIYHTAQGRNWARIIYLIFFLLGLMAFLADVQFAQTEGIIYLVVAALVYVLELFAMILLFSRSGNQWFKEMKNLKSQEKTKDNPLPHHEANTVSLQTPESPTNVEPAQTVVSSANHVAQQKGTSSPTSKS